MTSLTLTGEQLLQNWKQAHERALAYLAALGIPEADREELAAAAVQLAVTPERWRPGGDAFGATLAALREILPERYPPAGDHVPPDGDAFLAWRLDVLLRGGVSAPPAAPGEKSVFSSQPPLARDHMVPEKIERRFLRRLFRRLTLRKVREPIARGRTLRRLRNRHPWIHAARRRRIMFVVLVLLPSIVASGFMTNVLPHKGETALEVAIVLFFGALFSWISIGFWTALLGFFTLVLPRSRFAITKLEAASPGEFEPQGKTAIVMPICEEPVERVFAGLKAIHQSLGRTGMLSHFDFFVLSDTSDPALAVREEEAWLQWCREVNGFDHIFYRRRRVRLKRKSGNVADFCRRWGRAYAYMLMLDADSLMAGDTIVRLVHMMEQSPGVGMIQTAPTAVNRRSLLARVQQFAGRLYGPLFAAGLHYWQLGDGQYWGHNTIIRVAAFMAHCGLPKLPGKPPLGGEIMSHDFVEAALMGRSGWTLWLAYDLGGSYEELPSTLLEEMKRDRRWCQGNLQHLRLLFSEGLFGAHRALFLNGVLSYVSALLWFTFLSLSTAEAIHNALVPPDYFPHGLSLFPEWPVWRPDWAIALMSVTALILFLPKVLSILLILGRGGAARLYGGPLRMLLSVVLEVLLSSLLAPIRMVFHSRFVVQNLLGRTVQWRSQGREDEATSWGEAIRHHALDTIFATAWGTSLFLLNPDYFWWLTPIIGALILSIPLSVFTSRVGPGEWTRRHGLFLIPEESAPPRELQDLWRNQKLAEQQQASVPPAERDGFVRAAVDPFANALRRALARGKRRLRPSIRAARRELLERALALGPAALDARQRKVLLSDPEIVSELHQRIWQLPDRRLAALWGRPGA